MTYFSIETFTNYFQHLSLEESNEQTKIDESNQMKNSTVSINASETIAGFKVEDILNVVSKTADQGISIISNWFGLKSDDEESSQENIEIQSNITTNNTNATSIS